MNRFLIITFSLIFSVFTFAQETTGSLQGSLKDNQNNPIPFANVVLTDTETNFTYGAISQENGFYRLNNIPPGNKYTVTISFLGFTTKKENNLVINLGSTTIKNFILLEESTSLQEVVVLAESTPKKNGNETLLDRKAIKATPTINRSIQDLTKNLPENNLNSFAGTSNRFNNLNIDGIANNDIIGFQEPASGASGSSANGTPGSLSRSQPIGLGAVKQVSVKLSPFDVSIGNFNGASINLVTKNGTNTTKAEVYGYGNNQNLIGQYASGAEQDVQPFYDVQFGGGIGGAIIKDKLFYYVNFEQALSNTPVLNAPGSESSNISLDDVLAIRNRLLDVYNYDPGTFESADLKTASTKLFTRLDYNLSETHKLTLRNNYVHSFADNLEWNSTFFNFGNQGYRHNSLANSLALEVKSNFKNGATNKLSIGYNIVKEDRDFDGRVFPHIQIATSSASRIFAGTYREASVYNTDFSTLQIADTYTFDIDKHHFTAGIFGQLHNVDYGFLSAWNGRWEYRSVDDFLNDRPARIRGVYNVNNNDFGFVSNRPSATIGVFETAAFFQDNFRINEKFEITAGIRLDGQYLTQKLPISEAVRNTPEFSRFDNTISRAPQLNPRIGFNYKIDTNGKYTMRGGTGLFSGRIPYLWFAYAEYISGTDYFNIDIRPDNAIALTENLEDLRSVQPNLTEINVLDPNFSLPRDWKTNIAIKAKLPNRWTIDVEGTYTEVVNGLLFQSINRRDNIGNFSGADNRPYFLETGDAIKINPNFTNVFLLTNTDKGFRYNLTLGLSKQIGNYNGYLGYTYGRSKDISSTVRSSPAANFEWNQALVANDPSLSFSNFDLRHKFVSSHSYSFNIGKTSTGFVSFLYNGRAGTPFSYVYQGDLNRDGSSRNDVIYVPRDASEINLIDITDSSGNIIISASQQWERLNAFIEADPYLRERRGQIAERNGARTPWNHELDMKLEYGLKLKNGNGISLSFDMLNVFNFINRDWGRLVFVPNVVNSSFSLLNFRGIENNEPLFQFNIPEGTEPYVTDLFNSRWRAQFGLKYSF
ncbi:carboxypeptidase regulatory-like domain-containing protein [Aquimarina gracilis]|uniref:Carboxypeptidase regulatory-like domain-containing protein n=1 Tax=Aquimarina gracilis TaxID=874422 RepID=A0ABU5ZP27_9FLAO|nr:carboxypeptidase regulatory-like domain-containing protein [Aquimarina gracilis]MEB3343901.1 carboxypeptidase regulatory-like domain-containing protein [Aquimarina gracilis]